jgi:hypothetical protein
MKLPASNNQIIAIGGGSGRRVLHFNAATNIFTSIFNSTALSNITGCDITLNSANDKFYVAWCRESTNNTVTLTTGTLSSPTTAMTDSGALTAPGANSFTCVWTPDGNTLAVRTSTTIRTYYRAAGDVMTLNATSYTLSGGQTGDSYEELSWNALGTVLAAAQGTTTVTRYTLGSLGALTSLGASTVPGSTSSNRPIPAFNPNPSFAGVLAVGARSYISGTNSGFTFMYFGSNGSGTLNASPGISGRINLSTTEAVRQVRWSPTGDRIAMIYATSGTGVKHYPFTYSEGSTATVATGGTSNDITITTYAFDWIYY